MRFTFCPLFSGSSGNALFVGAGDTRLLIDAGLSGKVVEGALHQIGILPETLSGILVTHEHSDHIKGVGILSRRYRLPVYANARTFAAMARQVGEIPAACRRIFETDSSFYAGQLEVAPFAIPHDAAEPVGFRIYAAGRSVATATDMGYFSKRVCAHIAGADLLLLESNHDPDMLRGNAHYPSQLKARILSNHGHLSNEACAQALVTLYRTGVRHAVLGHLSGENNLPELAMRVAQEGVMRAGITPGSDLRIDMAWRDRVGKVYTLG